MPKFRVRKVTTVIEEYHVEAENEWDAGDNVYDGQGQFIKEVSEDCEIDDNYTKEIIESTKE